MKNSNKCVRVCLLASALALLPAQASLVHRYSFTTDASDSVGTANGTNLVNTAQHPAALPVVYSNGQASFDGSGGYIELPTQLIAGLTNLSIEVWATWNGTPGSTGDWQRFFDFGNTDAGGAGEYDMFLTPSYGGSGGKLRFGIANADPGYNNERDVSSANTFPQGTETHVVLTYGTNGGVNLYVNGVLDSSGPLVFPLSVVQDVYNYIGRSTYNDPPYNGLINEFRIHDSVLSPPQVAASFASGPDTVSYDPGAVTALVFTNAQTVMGEGDLQIPRFAATYAKAGDVVIGTSEGVTLSSDNTNVLVIKAGGIFAKAPGSASVTASLSGINTAIAITVTPAVPVLLHRYSFNDAPSSTTIADSVGGAAYAGALVPDSTGTTNVALTNGEAVFAGPATASYTTAPYIALPAGLFTAMTNLTIETWATWQGANAGGGTTWQRIFDFGDSGKGASAQNSGGGLDSLYLTVRDGGGNSRWDCFIPAGGGGETTLTGPGPLPIGKQTHLTTVYAPNRRQSTFYINGVPVASGDAANPLSALSPDGNNWLGASQWNDPPFQGSISEIRIYEGVLSDVAIAVSDVAGPDTVPSDPGTIQSVTLSVPPLLPGNPFTTQPSFLGTFQHATNVNISGVAGVVYKVGDTNVFTINTTGGMLAVTNSGTSTLVATYSGLSATSLVSVVGPVSLNISNLPASAVFDGPQQFTASLVGTFPGATNVDVSRFAGITWSVSDPLLANISANGVITPLSPGTLTVKGTYQGMSGTAQLVLNYAPGAGPAVLLHRYSFADSNVVDSVGGANGQALLDPNKTNPKPVVFTNGQAVLDGSGGYIALPSGLVSSLSNLTVEAWLTWTGGPDWQNIFVFGNTDANGAGEFGLFGTPTYGGSGGKFRLGFGNADPGYTAEFDVSSPNFFPRNTPTHLVVVYAPADGGTRIYINGALDVIGAAPDPLSDLQDVNDYLGRSSYNVDPAFQGSFDEFRIYDGALSGVQVAADYAAGPNNAGPRPTLNVSWSKGQLIFNWPLSATGAVLVVSQTLGAGASWSPTNAKVDQTNGVFSATVTPTQSPSFYRLNQ